MSDEQKLVFSLVPTWEAIKEIREKIKTELERKGFTELAEPAMMTSSELCENAVKYGSSLEGKAKIEFLLTVGDASIKIDVKNGIAENSDFENVKVHIDRIQKSDNPADLYVQRLTELMENPKPGQSQLGLYRIAYEGGFNLSYTFVDDILTVTAEREF